MHPYSSSSSYVGLLTSQTENVQQGNFPYESFPSSMNIGASDIPPFSSQQSQAPAVEEESPVQRRERPVQRRERTKWSPADDEVLMSAWLNTSKDAIVGNDQRGVTFWERVGEYYAASPHAKASGDKRKHLNCKQRWHKINDLTNKFCGAYAAAERQQSSGQSENDVLKAAHDIYYTDHKLKFNLEHAWCVLRYEQKWMNLNPPKASAPTASGEKRKTGEESGQSSSVNVDDHEIRPEGIKDAKARKNNASGKALLDYKSIWEIKKDELAMKEKLSKLAILDTLLAKKESLTEAEEVVKNKLLEEYF